MGTLDELIQDLNHDIDLDDRETTPEETERNLFRQGQALGLVFGGFPPAEDPGWLERFRIDPEVFEPPSDRSHELAVRKISFAQAMVGLQAASSALMALYRKTNQHRYSVLLDLVTLEAAMIAKADLASSAVSYRPLTARIGSSANALRSAHAQAAQLATDLKLAASILNVFGSLVRAI